ncbi:MAG: alpha-L-rhamnosidase C-terminal domain-containing protein [bacterium]
MATIGVSTLVHAGDVSAGGTNAAVALTQQAAGVKDEALAPLAALHAAGPVEWRYERNMEGASVAKQPYPVLNGGAFDGPVVKDSPDPLVAYRWKETKAEDGLQVYALRPVAAVADTDASFNNLASSTGGKTDIAVMGTGSIRFDFGVESAAWLEFDSPDCPGGIEMSISEYNQPAIVNTMPLHPVKTLAPVKYGNTYRLELNKDLYEGVRFGWIHVRSFTGVWHITGIRLVCQVKPNNYKGSFSCSDAMLTRVWYTGAYGVKLNLLKDYMGAILVDRGDRHSWTGDSHPSQAASMVAFGNFDFIRSNLERTSGKDWIQSYMLYWVSSMLDYYNNTGDTELLKKYTDNISAKLDAAYTAYGTNPQLGFYGWDERLAGFEVQSRNCPEAQNAYKMLSIRAWNDFAKAMESIGRTDLRDKYNRYVTEKVSQLRQNAGWYQEFGVHAMTDAVNAGFTSRTEQEKMFALEFNDKVNRVSFSPFNQYFIIQAMASMKRHDEALDTVRYLWGGMIEYGGTTFFEVFRPAWAKVLGKNDPVPNNQCGFTSLCHPWGGGVVKWLSEEVAGIKPVSPGFKEYAIVPHLGRTLKWVKGKVPTPHGEIGMSINVDSGEMSMSAPAGTTGRLGIPKMEKTIKSVTFDNVVVWDGVFHSANGVGGADEDPDFVYLTKIQPGTHAISVKYSGTTPGYVEPLEHYDVDFIKQDSVTGGSWGGKYGTEGYVLCSYSNTASDLRVLPSYVNSIDYSNHHSVQWTNQTSDLRALSPDKSNGVPRKAACVYTGNGGPTDILRSWNGQPLTVTIEVNGTRSYQVALYFVDWDRLGRSIAVEMFDAKTLKMVAPVQVIQDHAMGKYLFYKYDKSVKFRIQQIRGANAALSGIFFDRIRDKQ